MRCVLLSLLASIAASENCTFLTPVGAFDLTSLRLRHTTQAGWLYEASACADLEGTGVAPKCATVAPAPAFQVTIGSAPACLSLGALSSRVVATLPDSLGVSVTFSGGDGGRRAVLEVACHDGPTVVDTAVEERLLEYTLKARSRAACPVECARDPATGAVCGGRDRGACVAGGVGGAAVCACAKGHHGPQCVSEEVLVNNASGVGGLAVLTLLLALVAVRAAASCASPAGARAFFSLRCVGPVLALCCAGFLLLQQSPRGSKLMALGAGALAPLPPQLQSAPAGDEWLDPLSVANLDALLNASRVGCAKHFDAAKLVKRGPLNVSVGVVIGAFQRPALLQAIVGALRAQRLVASLEIAVADGGSWPPLAQQVPFLDVDAMRWWKEDGLYHRVRNFNEGAAMMHSEVVILLDDDVLPASDYWAVAAVAALVDNPQLAMVRLPLEILEFRQDFSDAPARRGELEALTWDTSYGFTTCNLAMRRSAWDALGGFSWAFDGKYGGEDIDFHQRAAAAGLSTGRAEKSACALHAGVFFGNRGIRKTARR